MHPDISQQDSSFRTSDIMSNKDYGSPEYNQLRRNSPNSLPNNINDRYQSANSQEVLPTSDLLVEGRNNEKPNNVYYSNTQNFLPNDAYNKYQLNNFQQLGSPYNGQILNNPKLRES
ncbi:hypothetical protein CEXT_458841 [Caerostris extrusa]|uniref:Uncharacterized protein n=1 Tax=Caerostris extrusa TaxID=172846 RepID=A0AAV4XZ49_CAEEX|nr:hypothetical protein CEXT_458841 [Caerostris extrusa]